MSVSSPVPPYHYRLCGLVVASDIPLPNHPRSDPPAALPVDVTLREGQVPERLARVTQQGPTWSIDGDQFLLDLPGIGRFLAVEGQQITLQPAPGMPVDDILVFATGTALAAILYQRGALLLHASAVVHRGRAVLFCGASGAGKSTLASALCTAGCGFLSDDICTVTSAANGSPMVHADGRVLRLYRDSIDSVGLQDAVGQRVRQHIDKFHVLPPATAPAEGVPLAAIYILGDANPTLPAGISRLSTLIAAQVLLQHSYRRRLALAYSGRGQLAARIGALLAHAPVYSLTRPRDLALLDQSVQRLHDHWDPPA